MPAEPAAPVLTEEVAPIAAPVAEPVQPIAEPAPAPVEKAATGGDSFPWEIAGGAAALLVAGAAGFALMRRRRAANEVWEFDESHRSAEWVPSAEPTFAREEIARADIAAAPVAAASLLAGSAVSPTPPAFAAARFGVVTGAGLGATLAPPPAPPGAPPPGRPAPPRTEEARQQQQRRQGGKTKREKLLQAGVAVLGMSQRDVDAQEGQVRPDERLDGVFGSDARELHGVFAGAARGTAAAGALTAAARSLLACSSISTRVFKSS